MVLPELAVKIGLNESMVLQQLHYWLKRSNNIQRDRKWVYFTYDKLVEQFPFFSKSTVRRAITKLKSLGLLLTDCFNKMKMDQTKWYSINYEAVNELNMGEVAEESNQTGESLDIDEQSNEIPADQNKQQPTESPANHKEEQPTRLQTNQNEQQDCSNKPSNNGAQVGSTSTTSSSPSHKNVDPIQFYKQNGFGVLSTFILEKIEAWRTKLSDDVIILAMKLALENGSARWNYVHAVLSDWMEKGYHSVEAVHAARLAFKQRQHKKVTRKELIPSWMVEKNNLAPKAPNPNFAEEKRKIEERIRGLNNK